MGQATTVEGLQRRLKSWEDQKPNAMFPQSIITKVCDELRGRIARLNQTETNEEKE